MTGWNWVDGGGLTGRDLIPLGTTASSDSSVGNAFDSHLCFAAKPVHIPGEGERLYYMGSNGKHSGSKPHRNASFGLARLRTDGFAGMAGSGNISTVTLTIAHAHITLTADILGRGGFVRVGVQMANSTSTAPVFFHGLSLSDSKAKTENVTDSAMNFSSGASLAGLVGLDAVFVVELQNAIVFTLGFVD